VTVEEHDGISATSAPEAEHEERERTFSRKALLQAGWAIPVAMAITPSVAFAQSGTHVDNGHTDAVNHTDVGVGRTHSDVAIHADT
jgi:formiminotetrahydrofolate cyclodeaminase